MSSVISPLAFRASDMIIKNRGNLPPLVLQRLWQETISYLCEQMLEAYAKVKKVGGDGNVMM